MQWEGCFALYPVQLATQEGGAVDTELHTGEGARSPLHAIGEAQRHVISVWTESCLLRSLIVAVYPQNSSVQGQGCLFCLFQLP